MSPHPLAHDMNLFLFNNTAHLLQPKNMHVSMCDSELCLLCVMHRVSSEDWPFPGQSQAMSFLWPVLL